MVSLPDGIDKYIDDLISGVQGLFDSKESFNVPETSENIIISPDEYKSPIHEEWRSSGGFDTSSKRPNGRVGHMGVDMRAPGGTSIHPLTSGIVSSVGTDPLGGNVVNINHPNGVRTYYAHLGTVQVQKGDKVTVNTVIGTVGNTGNARNTAPHLHFQVWKDNQIQNPNKYFSVPAYTDITQEEQKQGLWLSQEAKNEANQFNMQEHISSRRLAFSKNSDQLLKFADRYSSLAKFIF